LLSGFAGDFAELFKASFNRTNLKAIWILMLLDSALTVCIPVMRGISHHFNPAPVLCWCETIMIMKLGNGMGISGVHMHARTHARLHREMSREAHTGKSVAATGAGIDKTRCACVDPARERC
jgi:hypothetical protein